MSSKSESKDDSNDSIGADKALDALKARNYYRYSNGFRHPNKSTNIKKITIHSPKELAFHKELIKTTISLC